MCYASIWQYMNIIRLMHLEWGLSRNRQLLPLQHRAQHLARAWLLHAPEGPDHATYATCEVRQDLHVTMSTQLPGQPPLPCCMDSSHMRHTAMPIFAFKPFSLLFSLPQIINYPTEQLKHILLVCAYPHMANTSLFSNTASNIGI